MVPQWHDGNNYTDSADVLLTNLNFRKKGNRWRYNPKSSLADYVQSITYLLHNIYHFLVIFEED